MRRSGDRSPFPRNLGIATLRLGASLGSGGQSGGLNPLYQIDGPRSIQLALKLHSNQQASVSQTYPKELPYEIGILNHAIT